MTSDRTGLRQEYPASWRWLRIARRVAGWLTDAEGNALFELARQRAPGENAVVVELGSWQGKSSVLLGAGLSAKHNPRLFCIDPFGDDENPRLQFEYYEPLIETMGLSLEESFRRNIRRCGLTAIVQPIQAYSFDAVRNWRESIDILFIDASHEYDAVHRDFLLWAPFVKVGGIIAFHDVSPAWPGPSRVVAEDLQPPYFGGLEQADSLAWAVKKCHAPRAIPQVDSTKLPISGLDADREYLVNELRRAVETAESAQAAAKERARLLSEELRKTRKRLAAMERDLQRTTAALAEAEHASSSLRSSWSWRVTAPLRRLMDAALFLRSRATSIFSSTGR